MDKDRKEFLMGHSLPGARGNYFDRYDEDEFRAKYAKVQWRPGVDENRMAKLEVELAQAQSQIAEMMPAFSKWKELMHRRELAERYKRATPGKKL